MESKTMTVTNPKITVQAQPFSDDQIGLIKRTVAKGATDDELKLFLYQAHKKGLDPLSRQIYFQKRQDNIIILTAIDGYRLIASRTGLYAGNDDPVYDSESQPRRASATVYRLVGGQRCAFTATARWEQYYPGEKQGFMWKKMPHLMLGKCAEALALRKAFPEELSGVYVQEEMDQAGPPMAQSEPINEPLSTTQEDTMYTGAHNQKVVLMAAAAMLGIKETERLKKLHEWCLGGVPMKHMNAAIDKFLTQEALVAEA